MKRTTAIVGGDLRQVWLARLLLEDGKDIVTWGLEQGGGPNGVPLDRALEADCLILPLPVCREGKWNLPLTDTALDAEQLWPRLRYDQLLLGGMTGELSGRLMADFGLTLLDYYEREELQVANAVPTALAVGHTFKCLRPAGLLFVAFACIIEAPNCTRGENGAEVLDGYTSKYYKERRGRSSVFVLPDLCGACSGPAG